MAINFASICPHPPLIIPNIGKERIQEVSDTIEAMEELAEDLKQENPQSVIVISPHAPKDPNSFLINTADLFKGHFHQFGDLSTELAFQNDLELVDSIKEQFEEDDISFKQRAFKELDHGTLVPLYYLTQGKPNPQIVSLSYSDLSLEKHFQMGKALRKATEDRNVAIIASGDMSHRLNKQARKLSATAEGLSSSGYSPEETRASKKHENSSHPPQTAGEEFDKKLIELIKKKDTQGILNMDPSLVQEAGQCGYRSVIILLGALKGVKWKPEILSYEGPFGVGYLVVEFEID